MVSPHTPHAPIIVGGNDDAIRARYRNQDRVGGGPLQLEGVVGDHDVAHIGVGVARLVCARATDQQHAQLPVPLWLAIIHVHQRVVDDPVTR